MKNLIEELVINFHMTEACNYRCGFCYATWQDLDHGRELHRHPGQVTALLEQLAAYFLNPNPLQTATGYQRVRLNFAGGEPMLLGERFLSAFKQAHELGFRTSIITNAHYLDDAMLVAIAPSLSVLGISCDAVDPALQEAIGRVDRHGRKLTGERLVEIFQRTRELNPAVQIKMNTVVNAFNWQDDLNEFVRLAAPDKWKLLRVLPVHSHNLTISEEQYLAYVMRHQAYQHCVSAEDNASMTESYLMLNPEGRFYQNGTGGQGYVTSEPVLHAGVGLALKQIRFDAEAFSRRYRKIPLVAA